MIPEFTAAASLVGAVRTYRQEPGTDMPDGYVRPQQGNEMLLGNRTSTDIPPPVTCTCPCCLVVNGRLVCC